MKLRLVLLAAMVLAASPLLANDLWFPQIAAGGGYTTRITIAHVDGRTTGAVAGRIFFYNQDGTPRTVTTAEAGTGTNFPLTVVSQGTITLTVTSPTDLAVGAAVFRGVPIFVGGVATYTFGSTAVGVLPGDEVTSGYVPLVLKKGFDTGIAVVNTGENPIDVQFNLLNDNGSAGQTGSRIHIPIRGQIALLVGPQLGFSGTIPDGSTLQVSLVGSGKFAAVSLLLGNGYISSATIINPETVQTPLFVPQVAVGGGYSMIFRTFNTSNVALGGTLRFKDAAGQPLSLTVQGRGAGGVVVDPVTSDSVEVASLPAKGSMVWEVTATGPLNVGYAVWESYLPNNSTIRVPVSSGVSATIFSGPVHVGEAGTTPYYSATIAVEVGNGINTGIAVATAGSAGSSLRATLRDSKGASLAAPDLPFFNPFPAGSQLARYATELFGDITVAGGTLTVESTGPDGFLPLALFDNHGVFSTTATIRRYLVDPLQLTGKYTGSWKTSSSTGAISQTLSVDTSAKTITLSLSAAGDPAAPETMTCKYGQEGCIASFSSMLSGPGTVMVQPDGTLYIRARPMGFGFFNLDGYLTSGSMSGAWTIGLGSIRTTGVWTVSK
jgi:hypothetical protein